jgi:MFS family permease
MHSIFRSRPLRLLFAANFVSMIGSGMNGAAVIWFVLQKTHSESWLALLVVVQALPALLLMPFSGVVVDREDRRHVVMVLDAARGLLILAVALLALNGSVALWLVITMHVLVSVGFWMFWPTITALLQELTPEAQFADSNAMLLAGFQGGWLVAGAIVGFVYNHIGIGGILLIDFCTYGFSLTCYALLRRGRHVVAHHVPPHFNHPVRQFFHEMREGLSFVSSRRSLTWIGLTWGLWVGAMMIGGVVAAPISERILHAGAVGYGWLNAGWGVGAFVSTFYAARFIRAMSWRAVVPTSMAVICCAFCGLPFSHFVLLSSALYFIGGSARGTGGVALSSGIMEVVPKHFMGRVQTLFSIFSIIVQIALAPVVGHIAHNISLMLGIFCLASLYLLAAVTGQLGAKAANAQ